MKIEFPIIISLIALVLSAMAFWKTHLAPFRLVATFGILTLRIYPWRSGKNRWFVASADLPITLVNAGARVGKLFDLRIIFRECQRGPKAQKYILSAIYEIDTKLFQSDSKNPLAWHDSAVKGLWYPLIILPKEVISKHLIFEERWEHETLGNFEVTLEALTNASGKWQTLGNWRILLHKELWEDLAEKGRSIGFPDLFFDAKVREDQLKRLDEKILLGLVGSNKEEPSYLDYKEE